MREGQLLAEAQFGTTYHPQVGLEGVREILRSGIDQVLLAAGVAPDAIRHAFFGLPAYGEDSEATAKLHTIPHELLGHGRYACDNDMVCGWAGSLGCEDGINVVAGTGSIGYGQRQGKAARAGGWGEAFSDEGSAYWIAAQGLNVYSRMSDGRLPKGPLHALFNQELDLATDLDICARVYGEHALSRGDFARLSLLVAKAAGLGDADAADIYRQAGDELAQIADSLRRALDFHPLGNRSAFLFGRRVQCWRTVADSVQAGAGSRLPHIRTADPATRAALWGCVVCGQAVGQPGTALNTQGPRVSPKPSHERNLFLPTASWCFFQGAGRRSQGVAALVLADGVNSRSW